MATAPIDTPASEALALRSALYGRASSDPKKRGRSIKDQFAEGELECEDRGWTIVDRYEDRDRSASRSARRVREDYTRMVADMEAGLMDVIVYAERSRANRDMDHAIKLRKLCERTSVLLCYGGRVYNMHNPTDRRDFTRDSVASEEESEAIRERALRTARLNAKRGAPHGRVPFGYARRYDPDEGHLLGQVPHPDHAKVVRDLFTRAAARESFVALTADLAKYIPDTSRYGLRYILRNKAYIGIRMHNGAESKAAWDAIVPEELFWRVQAVLAEPERRTVQSNEVTHLLSGIAPCEACLGDGAAEPGLVINRPRHYPRPCYRCPRGHVQVAAERLDAYVEEALFVWFGTPAAALAFQAPDGGELEAARARLAALTFQLGEARELAGQFHPVTFQPKLPAASLAVIEAQVGPAVEAAEAEVRRLTAVGDPAIGRLMSAGPERRAEAWERLTMAQRRHVVRCCVNVRLRPAAVKGSRRLDSDRVRLVFAGQPGFAGRPSRRRLVGLP
jgi:DNA invertase Pin-like site-specific DNA recombinase